MAPQTGGGSPLGAGAAMAGDGTAGTPGGVEGVAEGRSATRVDVVGAVDVIGCVGDGGTVSGGCIMATVAGKIMPLVAVGFGGAATVSRRIAMAGIAGQTAGTPSGGSVRRDGARGYGGAVAVTVSV